MYESPDEATVLKAGKKLWDFDKFDGVVTLGKFEFTLLSGLQRREWEQEGIWKGCGSLGALAICYRRKSNGQKSSRKRTRKRATSSS